MVYTSSAQAQSHLNDINRKIYMAKEYLDSLLCHKENYSGVSRRDLEIRRCTTETKKGIERLEQEALEIKKIVNTINTEIIIPSWA